MLTHLQNKITALQNFSFKDELVKIVNDNKDKLADLQREQLAAGIDSNNDPIRLKDNSAFGYGYRPFTISVKKATGRGTGAITSHVTWYMTGQLHKSIRAFIHGEKFSLKSPDMKFSKLIQRSGEEAVGLNVDSRTEFIDTVTRPKILKAYKEKVTDV